MMKMRSLLDPASNVLNNRLDFTEKVVQFYAQLKAYLQIARMYSPSPEEVKGWW
jgi:hypothetical protein